MWPATVSIAKRREGGWSTTNRATRATGSELCAEACRIVIMTSRAGRNRARLAASRKAASVPPVSAKARVAIIANADIRRERPPIRRQLVTTGRSTRTSATSATLCRPLTLSTSTRTDALARNAAENVSRRDRAGSSWCRRECSKILRRQWFKLGHTISILDEYASVGVT